MDAAYRHAMTLAEPAGPGSTAVRTALWRALHVELDAQPPVHADVIGLRLLEPPPGWRQRPDMDPEQTRGFRAAIVGRARAVEDEVAAAAASGVGQYVQLGAGLDTYAQRHPDAGPRLRIFEIDTPALVAWKRARLTELGLPPPSWLRLVGADLARGSRWWDAIVAEGWDPGRPTILAAIGLSMYLPRPAIDAILRQGAQLSPGSILLLSFLLPLERIDAADQPTMRMVMERAAASGTPFVSLLDAETVREAAMNAGFKACAVLDAAAVIARYFSGRADGLRPASGEAMLIARR